MAEEEVQNWDPFRFSFSQMQSFLLEHADQLDRAHHQPVVQYTYSRADQGFDILKSPDGKRILALFYAHPSFQSG